MSDDDDQPRAPVPHGTPRTTTTYARCECKYAIDEHGNGTCTPGCSDCTKGPRDVNACRATLNISRLFTRGAPPQDHTTVAVGLSGSNSLKAGRRCQVKTLATAHNPAPRPNLADFSAIPGRDEDPHLSLFSEGRGVPGERA